MSIKIFSLVNSDTIGTSQIFYNQGVPEYGRRLIGNWSINSQKGKNLIRKIVIEDDEQGAQDLLKVYIDDFYVDAQIYIETTNIKIDALQNKFNKAKPSKAGAWNPRFQDIKNPRSWITRKTYLKRYNLNGLVMNSPFINYENNDSGDNNCVLTYVKNHYKKISKKRIDEYFNKKNVTGKNIFDFCDRYKIQCKLYNVAKTMIYSNEYSKNTYPAFVATIANNHLYPLTVKNKSQTASMPNNSIEKIPFDNIDFLKDIVIETNKNLISGKGSVVKNELDQVEIDKAFFKGLIPNWLYEAETSLKFKSLMYNNERIQKDFCFEIDLNKAFFTIAEEIIDRDSSYPVFTCFDFYEKKSKDEEINEMYYYLLSKDSLNRLSEYGFITNSQPGTLIKYLLEVKLITMDDIEFRKKCSYTGQWSDIVKRIDSLLENNPNIPKEYIYYNGLLGRVTSYKTQEIYNILKTDEKLFDNRHEESENIEDAWECTGWENERDEAYGSFRKEQYKHRFINMINIYNNIIANCSLFLLKALQGIKDLNDDCTLMKIRVDSLGFDRIVKIPKEYQKYFKVIVESQVVQQTLIKTKAYPHIDNNNIKKDILKKNHYEYHCEYFDGSMIRNDVCMELDTLDKNISYHGCPGTGKTYTVQNNHYYDYATTTTNVCSLNIGTKAKPGNTIYSLLNLFNPENLRKHFNKYRNRTIWIDEFSMIQKHVWNYIMILATQYNTKFIITGDIHQIGPIGEKKIDLNNEFSKKLMGNLEVLDKEWRNDRNIIKLRSWIMNESDETVKSILIKREDKNPYMKYDRHLCYTNKAKDIINEMVLKEKNYTFQYYAKNNDIYLDVSKGCILSARLTKKNDHIFKGDIWKVVAKVNDGYSMSNCIRENEVNFFSNDKMKYFTLGFCTTVHSSQGLTICEDMCIHEIQKMIHADKDILYTAVTRSRKFKKLHIYNFVPIGKNIKIHNLCKLNSDEDEIEFVKFDKIKSV